MNRLALFLVFALVPARATGQEEKAGPNDNKPPEGFQLLFNGKDLIGWQGVVPFGERSTLNSDQLAAKQRGANETYLPHWSVENGVLVYDGKGNSLQTMKDYGNFELRVDWKILARGDSGIYLRGQPQVQIWDTKAPEYKKHDADLGSGGLWNNGGRGAPGRDPLVHADKPVGEWNSFRIVMKGDRATIYLNDQLVVDNQPLRNYWDKGKKPLPAKGPIELQHHGNKLWFKNIYIKELLD